MVWGGQTVRTSLSVAMLVGLAVLLTACGGAKNRVGSENAATPGRDKELYEQASQSTQYA